MVTSRPQLSKYYFCDQNDELIFRRIYDSLENPISTSSTRLIYLIENNYPKDIRFYLVPEPIKYKVELKRDFKIEINCDGITETKHLNIDNKYSAVFFKPDKELFNCKIKAITKYQDEYFTKNKKTGEQQLEDSVSIKL